MAVFTFDGPNLRIIFPSGVTEIDAQDLYSRWKDWYKTGTNSRFPIAFTTSGGAGLPGGVDEGRYYTLQNQLGWRIRPPEEDINISVVGNLVPADDTLGTTGIVVPTLGGFTALVLGIQPITQNVRSTAIASGVWDSLSADYTVAGSIGQLVRLMGHMVAGNVTITGTGPYTITVTDPNDLSNVSSYTVSADQKIQTKN